MRQVELAFFPGRQLKVLGRLHEVVQSRADQTVEIRRLDTGLMLFYRPSELATMVSNQQIEFADQPVPPIREVVVDLSKAKPSVRARIERRQHYLRHVLPHEGKGPNHILFRKAIEEAAAELQDENPPSCHTVYGWIRRFARNGCDPDSLATEALAKRTRTSRLPRGVRDTLVDIIANVAKSSKKRSLHSHANAILEESARRLGYSHYVSVRRVVTAVPGSSREKQHLGPLTVSYETLRVLAHGLNRYDLLAARRGRAAAENERAPRTGTVVTLVPLERVEMDNFLVDVHVRCPFTGAILGRAWVTAACDCATGMVLGYYISFAPPSSESVLATLRHAVMPKPAEGQHRLIPVPDGFEWLDLPQPESPCCGVPITVAMDNGPDYTSDAVKNTYTQLGIEPLWLPPWTPWYKAAIESFGQTMNIMFIHWLPGSTFGESRRGPEDDPQSESTILYPHLVQLLEHFFYGILPYLTKKRGTHSPIRLWREGTSRFPVRVPINDDQFDAAVSLSYRRTLRQTGVELHGLHYNSNELGDVWNRIGDGQRITVRLNPTDIRTVLVIRPDNGVLLRVPCVQVFEHPRTLTYHIQYREWCREEGYDPDEVRLLEENQRKFNEAILQARRYGKALLRRYARMSQEVLAQAGGVPVTASQPLLEQPAGQAPRMRALLDATGVAND